VTRILRKGLAAVAALSLAALTALPAGPAAAAALPKPRSEEWWFIFWEIEHRVWAESTGQGVTVAVADTGVNAQLPELNGVVLPGGDGRRGGSSDGRTDFDTEKSGHGTEMAALIAGQGGGTGMVGVAPGVKILPIVINSFSDSIVKAIHYAVDHRAQVINFSTAIADSGDGVSCSTNVQQAVSYAIDKGIVIVAGTGNDGNTSNLPRLPAACAGVLAVGATNNQKLAWVKSQRQPYVSVGAPGVEVGSVGKDGKFNNTISGTSQASALAAGAVALVRSKYPKLSPREVVQRIINTTIDAGPAGPDNMTGSGAVVPIWALTKDVPKSAPNPTFDRLDRWRKENPELLKAPWTTNSSAPAIGPSTKAGPKKSSSSLLLPLAASGVVVIGVAIGAFLLLRRRRPRNSGPMPFAQEQGGSRQGPPPSFGPGRPGPLPPLADGYPQNPPPGPGQPPRPTFLPPSGKDR
jgi:type VII secretion-associated serine protease mycosin